MARHWGKIGDRHGHVKILVLLLFLTATVYLPGAFINHFWQLVLVRFILGMAIGGIIPVRIAYIHGKLLSQCRGSTWVQYEPALFRQYHWTCDGRNGCWFLRILRRFHHDQHVTPHSGTCPLFRDAPQSGIGKITLITLWQESLLPDGSRLSHV